MSDSTIQLACVPDAIPAEKRAAHFALIAELLTREVREQREINGGYEFRFDADAFVPVTRFVATERLCCPFLEFSVEVTPGAGPLWLRLTGPAGTKEFLDEELLSPARVGA
jgi:hypothetical protein